MTGKPDIDSTDLRDARDEKRVVITMWKMLVLLASLVVGVVTSTLVVSNEINESKSQVKALQLSVDAISTSGSEQFLRLQGEMKGRFDGIDNRLNDVISVRAFEDYLRLVRALNPGTNFPPFRP